MPNPTYTETRRREPVPLAAQDRRRRGHRGCWPYEPQAVQGSVRLRRAVIDAIFYLLRTGSYAPFGDFRFFTMLFVTLNKERVENIRQSTHDLPAQLAQYYRLTTYDQAMGDFLGQIWVSRSASDTQLYPLVRV